MDEVYGTLTINVHVCKPAEYRGERAERHFKVAVFRKHSVQREEAMEAAKEFAGMNPHLKAAGLMAEWQVREDIYLG